VCDGEEVTLKLSRSAEDVLKAMFTTDEDILYVHDASGKQIGWVFFIYGNDGYDVVHDYTTNLEPIMKTADAIADQYAD
jgi:hypothetical protein